ncbi:MAG TPA: PepSY-associated TM helix domain-containing protein [Telluria sp.]
MNGRADAVMRQGRGRFTLTAGTRSLLWRIHFWAALLASPFILIAVLTGILYIFTPQIEGLRYAALDRVTPAGAMRPLDDAVAAARTAAPEGWRVRAVLPPYSAASTVRVLFEQERSAHAGHEGHPQAAAKGPVTVSVNPYTAGVTGSLANDERFGNWSMALHSRLLQGDGWRWMIELAASAMMVMLVTGVLLWWPATACEGMPRAGVHGRKAWQQWHAFLGVALALVTATILITGLTWSKYAGEQIRAARDALGQASPAAPRNLLSAPANGRDALTWQAVWDSARKQAPDVPMQISPPRDAQGVWRLSANDPGQPFKRFDLLLDAYDAHPLYFSDWNRLTAFGKATAVGIPFHRGEFGWWNQALLTVFGLGVLFSLVSGWVMYFKRRQPGRVSLPRMPKGAWAQSAIKLTVYTVLACTGMPVLTTIVAVVIALEYLLGRQTRKNPDSL